MAESDIFVRFGADIEPLKQGAKTATQHIKGVGSTAAKVAVDVAKITTAAAAAGVAIAAFAKNSANSAREIRNLSQVAGLGVKEFQNLSFAAKTVGVEQDKLADIFKDTQDKVGDFMATGAGPMADFFEKIAPKVGVTAENFKDLSGADALGLYVESLEKANVSQNEMTFYLEAIASDASLLQPLLKNNSEQFRNLASEANSLNVALDDTDIKILEDMNQSLEQVQKVGGNVLDKFAVELAPVIESLADEFLDLTKETNGFEGVAMRTVEAVATGVGVMANAWTGVEVAVGSVKLAFESVKAGGLAVFGSLLEGIDVARVTILSNVNGIIDGLNNIPGVDIANIAMGGESDLTARIREMATEANQAMAQSRDELHSIMMAPLPSEQIESFLASVREKNEQERVIALEHQQNLTNIDEQGKQGQLEREKSFTDKMKLLKESWTHAETDAVAGMFGNLSSLMQTENKRMFEIGKTAAKAQTIVSTYSSAQKAYESLAGIPIVGPGLGAAAAAAAVIAGGVRLQAINATSFGSGSVSAGGGATATPAASGAAAAAPAEPERVVRLEQFDPNALFTGETVTNLANQLVELQEDGYRLMV